MGTFLNLADFQVCYCLAFFRMVPTAEMTVVLVPLAVVVTDTTPGSVAVVVRRAGWAKVTGTAESHLLFLFWASGEFYTHNQLVHLH